MDKRQLISLLSSFPLDANIVFCAKDDYFGFNRVAVSFVRYCHRDNCIYLYEYEPGAFAKEEQQRGIEIYELKRGDSFVETSYREK